MATVKPSLLLATALILAALMGCSKEMTSADVPAADPYPGLTGQARVDAIRHDPKLTSMDKATKIADAQKAAGLPITGQ